MPESELPQFLTAKQLGEWLGISEQALAQDRFRGDGIPYIKIGVRVRYRRDAVLAYIERNETGGAQEPTAPAKQPARVHTARRR